VALESTGQLRTPGRWLAWVLGLAALESLWSPPTEFFSLNEAPYLLAFLLWGLGAMRFPELFTRRVLAVLLVVLLAGIALQQAALRHTLVLPNLDRNSPLGTLVGLAGTVLLFRAGAVWGPLVWLGQYAYAIYLLHVFGTAGMRIGLRFEGVTSLPVLFLACLAAGLLFPIAAERVCERFAWTRVLVLGRRSTAAPGAPPHPGPVAPAL
jgi:peptidoglycan/LPS O-acetylase OafA/YrhL